MKEEKFYKFYKHEKEDGSKEIIAVSSYAGKTVKAKAVCDPVDEFDEEKGKKLAKLRCDIKIENKRLKRAIKQKSDLLNLEADIEKLLIKNSTYLTDTFDAIEKNKKELEELLEELA